MVAEKIELRNFAVPRFKYQVIICEASPDGLRCTMQTINALTTTAINLKLNGEHLAKVHFEHIPRANEVITIENEGTRYSVKSVEYNIRKNSGGDVTCETIDVVLAAA